mmetsp:Transcript_14361/g.24490  ORF Transcript_14361/g.24490 Transcript_14361/m.24490 type:complete len:224 (-) Transcript_14361:209-880(-)
MQRCAVFVLWSAVHEIHVHHGAHLLRALVMFEHRPDVHTANVLHTEPKLHCRHLKELHVQVRLVWSVVAQRHRHLAVARRNDSGARCEELTVLRVVEHQIRQQHHVEHPPPTAAAAALCAILLTPIAVVARPGWDGTGGGEVELGEQVVAGATPEVSLDDDLAGVQRVGQVALEVELDVANEALLGIIGDHHLVGAVDGGDHGRNSSPGTQLQHLLAATIEPL